MIKQTLLLGLISSSCSLPLLAQVPPNRSQPANDTVVQRSPEQKKSPYGNEIPAFDFTNKTVSIGGKNYGMGDNNIGGQFEAYLATDTLSSDAAKEYRINIRQILDYLAPNKTGGGKLKSAYDLLDKAAEYPGDGNLCESLANAIYAAQLTNRKKGSREEYANKLKKERDRLIRNMGVISSKLGLNRPREGEKPRPEGENSIEYIQMSKRVAEIEVILRQLEVSGMMGMTQSKLQFQSMIVQLFVQRRFEHVIMATRFYSLIYKDGDNRLVLKKGSDAGKLFAEGLGVDPTVAGLDAAAAEAINKVETLVSAFKNNLNQKRVHAATDRLLEAFIVGEFLPCVQTIPIKSKAPIQQYIQDANDMIKVLGANDLDRAEELNESLQEQATDYNASEARSYISGRKTESKLNTRDAKIALRFMLKSNDSNERNNERVRFQSAMANATAAWPSNPELKQLNDIIDEKFEQLTIGDDMLLVARKDFDRYVDTKSWSAVMKEENLSRFLASFHLSKDPQDAIRAKLLKEIKNDFTAIFATLKEAETYYERGHAAAAWELVDISIKLHPNSLELAKAKAMYSGKAATFANTIAKAQDLENLSAKSAHALTWYLKAEMIHPDSQYAKEGIDRIIAAKYKPAKEIKENYEDVAVNF